MPILMPADVSAILDHYLAVTIAALGTDETPFAGKSFVQPGGEVAWDECDCDGQAWSRFIQATPVYGAAKANGIPCVVLWEVTLAVGVLKCVTTPTGRGRLPTEAQITDGGHVFADDLTALMTAIECDDRKYRVVSAVPLGPMGGCAGSEVQFTVRMVPCCD